MHKFLNKVVYLVKHEGIITLIKRPYKLLIKCINKFLIFVFSIFPIKNNKIILESQGDYCDNVRAFSDFLNTQSNNAFHSIWLVQNPSKFKNKEQGTFVSRNEFCINFVADYHIATSKFFIFSHPYWLKRWRKEQIVINTTHSIAQLKASGKEWKKPIYNYILVCSEYCKSIKKISFSDNCDDHYLCLGQPRLDLMFKHKDCRSLLLNNPSSKFVLCMETFKQTKTWDDGGNSDRFAINVISSIDEMKELNSYLYDNNTYIVVKTHHLQDMSYIESVNFSNILYFTDYDLENKGIQVNELLEDADVLITDYSSVFYDYLLKNRPIGFLIGDINNYKRGFIMDDPFDEMPGEIINNYKELISFLDNCLSKKDDYVDKRLKICNKVFKYKDGNNSRRLYEWLYNNM